MSDRPRHQRTDWHRSEQGSAAIEFAFLAPIFAMILFFAIQLSIGFHKSNTVERAVEKATRLAFLDRGVAQSDIQTKVNESLRATDPTISITVTYVLDNSTTIPVADVRADYSFTITPLFLPSFNLNNAIRMKVPVAPR